VNISDIRIGERHRKDLGDIASLAKSIADIGLLHPVVVTPDGTLIAGARRVAACKLLGWQEIPATVVDLQDIVRGEHDENALRKDFTPSEAVAIARALEPIEREAAKERQATLNNHSGASENFTEASKGNALDKVAQTVGMSRPTFTKASEVVEAAEQEPELFAPVLEQMDRTGNVHGDGCQSATSPHHPHFSVDTEALVCYK
jgi:ParB family chromosome partitioning protein